MLVRKNGSKGIRILAWLFGGIVLTLCILLVSILLLIRFSPKTLFTSAPIRTYVSDSIGEDAASILSIVPDLLGIQEPKTYLVLFLNDTELRPGGGFIGSYGIIRVSGGSWSILSSGGSETLDWKRDDLVSPAPPRILTDALGVSKWYFRDSNWSPDFSESAKRSLALYANEHGPYADQIDGVIGVTTHVLEELLKQTGPVTVDGITFSSDTAVETLQYEVEYGYADDGIAFAERKQLLEHLFTEVLHRVEADATGNVFGYVSSFLHLAEEKHIQVYLTDPKLDEVIANAEYGGRVHARGSGDYLLYVDANLAALKTDHAIQRQLSYSVSEVGDYLEARAAMTYEHTGRYDWRTTKYKTYARVYVPLGSSLQSIVFDGHEVPHTDIDEGIELDAQWFGVYVSIEPQTTKTLAFSYRLPHSIQDTLTDGTYTLFHQKQAGTLAIPVTYAIHTFAPVRSATPAEEKKYWGDAIYSYAAPLRTDTLIRVNTDSAR